jgi:hypothetical protein
MRSPEAFGSTRGDPWYGSALLASVFLHHTKSGSLSRIHRRFQDVSSSSCNTNLRVLELVSGAVAIPGLAVVLALLRHRFLTIPTTTTIIATFLLTRFVLTDNDPEALNQLRRNARTASRRFAELAQQESKLAPRIVVHHLDWAADTHCFDLCCIDLAIGSELVYTPDTASLQP